MNDKKIKIHYEGELMGEVIIKDVPGILADGPTDENAARKLEGRRRLDRLIEERFENLKRFMDAVEMLHTKETKNELITTFEIAQKLTAEIHELSNCGGKTPERTLEEIISSSRMTDEDEITKVIHDKMQEVEYLRGVLRVMAGSNPPE